MRTHDREEVRVALRSIVLSLRSDVRTESLIPLGLGLCLVLRPGVDVSVASHTAQLALSRLIGEASGALVHDRADPSLATALEAALRNVLDDGAAPEWVGIHIASQHSSSAVD